MEKMDNPECTQNNTNQEIPGVLPHRLRDREQLRKRKQEAQEKKTSQWVIKEKSKIKRGRKGKASGTSRKQTKNPEPEPEPESEHRPEPGPPQQDKEEVADKPVHPDPESERSPLLEESAKLSITGETSTPSTDDAGETKSPDVEIPEILQLQAEDLPGENEPFEEQMLVFF